MSFWGEAEESLIAQLYSATLEISAFGWNDILRGGMVYPGNFFRVPAEGGIFAVLRPLIQKRLKFDSSNFNITVGLELLQELICLLLQPVV